MEEITSFLLSHDLQAHTIVTGLRALQLIIKCWKSYAPYDTPQSWPDVPRGCCLQNNIKILDLD